MCHPPYTGGSTGRNPSAESPSARRTGHRPGPFPKFVGIWDQRIESIILGQALTHSESTRDDGSSAWTMWKVVHRCCRRSSALRHRIPLCVSAGSGSGTTDDAVRRSRPLNQVILQEALAGMRASTHTAHNLRIPWLENRASQRTLCEPAAAASASGPLASWASRE